MYQFQISALILAFLTFVTDAKSKPLPLEEFLLSPFNEVNDFADFDFSGQASPSGCSGSVVSFGQADTAKAVLMTNAHCVGMLSVPPDTIFRDRPYSTNVRLYQDRTRSINVRSTRILYGTIHIYDLALVELNATYKELAEQGVRSRKVASAPLAVGSPIVMASGYFRTATNCSILAIIPFIHEDEYRNINSYKYRECDARHGTSGSPLIDAVTGEIVGINYTGNDDGERCTYNNPCEVDESGNVTVDKGAGYGDPVHQIMTCLDEQKELDLTQAGCALPL